MAEMTLKMNAFEPLAMDEMMAVDGGIAPVVLGWYLFATCAGLELGYVVNRR